MGVCSTYTLLYGNLHWKVEMTPFKQHPLREEISNEIHSRPYVLVQAPARVSYIAMCMEDTSPDAVDAVRSHLATLCRTVGVQEPEAGSHHHIFDMGNISVRWERHTEFFTLTLTEKGPFDHPFRDPPLSRLSPQWTNDLPGQAICATHMAIETDDVPERSLADIENLISGPRLVGAEIVSGGAQYWTDLSIHADGFGRVLVRAKSLSTRQLGRVVRRLMEIDTYRAMAMLAFPTAQAALPTVASAESRLSDLVERLATGSKTIEDERSMLDELSELSAEVELTIAKTAFRFNAARAYEAIVANRVQELREERWQGLQPAGNFLYRRLAPAMATCESVSARQRELARRVGQATDLLRTRVDVALEEQNKNLLESMNQRAKVQLRLQQTVEGLSVVAISYYAVSLILYVAKGLKEAGALNVAPEIVAGISLPFIALLAWAGMRRARRAVEKRLE